DRADHRRAHRPGPGDHRPGRRPGPVVHRRGGEGVRDGRPRGGLVGRRPAARVPAARGPGSGGGRVMGQYTIPNVVERTPQGERAYDIYSKLLAERVIFLGTEI